MTGKTRRRFAPLLIASAACGACQSNGPGMTPGHGLLPSASTEALNADWNDVDAAVGVAAGKNEMAVVWTGDRSERNRTFLLRTVRDEPVYLVIGPEVDLRDTASGGPPVDEPIPLQMRCTVGRFGDRDREQDLLEDIAERLEQLRGRDAAPLE